MTAGRTIAVGFGGAGAVLVAAILGNLLGVAVQLALGEEWMRHASVHVAFGGFALAIALWVGRFRGAALASGWAERGLDGVRPLAVVVSATAVVEGVGAYPPLEALHTVVWVNVLALLLLLLGFLSIAAAGVGRLVRARRRRRSA